MSRLSRCHNVADLREAARRRLPRFVFEFMDRGTEDEIALRENRAGFDRLRLRPDVMVDVSRRSLATDLFGKPSSLPLAMSPTGAAGLCWHEGEVALAKAAARAGVPFALSTTAITSMERVASAAGGRLWFQLYMWRDRALSYELVNRARAAGYEALILTVDTPVGPNREYNLRNGFSVPFNPSLRSSWDLACHPDWLINTLGKYIRTTGMPRHENYPAQFQRSITSDPATKLAMKNDSMSWADIPRLRDIWPGTLIIKGVLRPEDAVRAVEQGVDAIIVSNHGGRNMDSAVAPIDALPDIAAAVARRCHGTAGQRRAPRQRHRESRGTRRGRGAGRTARALRHCHRRRSRGAACDRAAPQRIGQDDGVHGLQRDDRPAARPRYRRPASGVAG